MINTIADDRLDGVDRAVSRIYDLGTDHNGNDHFEREQLRYFQMLHESSPDPDSLSIISDYSVMGQEIKQSIKFSDMIMSTYADLKNPDKSITIGPSHASDPDMVFRKHNMLSLAMEFSKWKESNADLSLGGSLSDSDSRCLKDDHTNDTTMVSCSPSLRSDFSSVDHCFEPRDEKPECNTMSTFEKSPLQLHIDNKFDETFFCSKSSSESEVEEDNKNPVLKIARPAWAQSIFHRDTLAKMPKSIRSAAGSIRNFDLSKEKYLKLLNLSQLQLVVNGLMTQVEELNESLVATLITRDELKSEQNYMVIQIEELTIKAKDVAQHMRFRQDNIRCDTASSQNYGVVHRFLSNLMCSPKFASNRVVSFFTQSTVSRLPAPEFV